MNSPERLLKALDGGKPDRLPVTTHHVMPSFLDDYLNGASEAEMRHQRSFRAETRKAVRRCFEEAGQVGGYILSLSNHLVDADVEMI